MIREFKKKKKRKKEKKEKVYQLNCIFFMLNFILIRCYLLLNSTTSILQCRAQTNMPELESDQSTGKSILLSVDEESITEVYPR